MQSFSELNDAFDYQKKAVKRGAKYLDKNISNWYSVIDINSLDLSSCTDCVCGQIARSSSIAIDKIREEYEYLTESDYDYTEMIHIIYNERADKIRKKGVEIVDYEEVAVYYGFCIVHLDYNVEFSETKLWNQLDNLWQKEIRKRLKTHA